MTAKLASTFLLLIGMILSGCNLPAQGETTPTLNVTQAYQTVEARLTEAIALTPRVSATASPQATNAPLQASPSATQLQETVTPSVTSPPSATCNQAMPGVPIDVTIPDDTQLRPGESFTKTWRLQNVGTCPWTSDYSLVWFSGERLEAPLEVPITGTVAYGGSVDLSVDMRSPDNQGTFQSNWKLRDPSGALFGIGPNFDSAFWVRIVVAGDPIITGTPTSTTTITPTATPTAGVQVSGSATLELENRYDLDNNRINSGGEDLIYQESGENLVLVPFDNAGIVIFGRSQPGLNDCQDANLASDPLNVASLSGTYLCYRTNMALPGWALINSLDTETGLLNLDIFTWSIP